MKSSDSKQSFKENNPNFLENKNISEYFIGKLITSYHGSEA